MKKRRLTALILSLFMLAGLLPLVPAAAEDPTGMCNHNWYWHHTTATCTGSGLDYYRCTKCGAEMVLRRGPLGHDYGDPQPDIPATCEEAGRDVRICSRNPAHVWYVEVPALGHLWGEWEVVTPATTTSPGWEKCVCQRDPSHVMFREIPQLEEDELPLADINLSVSWPSGPYHVDEHVPVTWTVENIGDVALTYRDCDGDAMETTLPAVLEPSESYVWTVDHVITEEDYNNGFHLSSESGEFVETTFEHSNIRFYAAVEYGYDPGYGNIWDCFEDETVFEEIVDGAAGPALLLENSDGSGAGLGLGDWVTTHLTFTNIGETTLIIHDQATGGPASAKMENYDFSEIMAIVAFGDTFYYEEGNSYDFGIQILQEDIDAGAVIRQITLMAHDPHGAGSVSSNTVEVNIPLDGGPAPTTDEARLSLTASCLDPDPFSFDSAGHTGPVSYVLYVTNTGDVPVHLTSIVREAEGDPTSEDISGLNIVLLPNDSHTLLSGYDFSDTQVVNGNELHISFSVQGLSATGPVESEPAAIVHHVYELPPDTPEPATVTVLKEEDGHSLNLGGYVEGETVHYSVTVTNTSDVMIPLLTVSDDLCPGQDQTLTNLMPHESRTVSFSYVVTASDVDKGVIYNYAFVNWTCPVSHMDMLIKDVCYVYATETPDSQVYGFDLVKSSVTTPPGGPYWQENETVTFYVYVENTSTAELYDVTVTDPLTGDVVHYATMAPGQIDDLYFTYTITYPDAYAGSLTNTVYVSGHDADGKEYAMSASHTIPTGIPPEPGTPSLYIFKETTSSPDDPRGYQEGEWINYTITVTNDGDVPLTPVEVYDIAPDGSMILLGVIPTLSPHVNRVFHYTWQVQDWNVADEWVWNAAVGSFSTREGDRGSVMSSTEDPTWGETPPPPRTGSGASCVFTLTAGGAREIWYDVDLCPEHGNANARSEALIAEGKWDEVCALWLDEVHRMYGILARRPVLRDAAHADQAAFEVLASSMPDGQEKAEWLMLQCAELCYLNANAPRERPDSRIFGRVDSPPTLVMAGGRSECGVLVGRTDSRHLLLTERFCDAHSEAEEAVIVLLRNSVTRAQYADAFDRALQLWRSQLDIATKDAWDAADEEARPAVLAARRAFDLWLSARAELLNALYPDSPETVAEVLCNTLRRHLLNNCTE